MRAVIDVVSSTQTLLVTRRHFGRGGPRRIPHTLVPLVYTALKLASYTRQLEQGLPLPSEPPKPKPDELLALDDHTG